MYGKSGRAKLLTLQLLQTNRIIALRCVFLLAISARTYFKSHHRHEQLRAHETQNNAP